jgi:coniferyl-aldehyde dehydrogenase
MPMDSQPFENTEIVDAEGIFQRQRADWLRHPFLSPAERLKTLLKIEKILVKNQDAIADVLCRDFGNRSIQETKLLEIYPTVAGLADARRRLRKWMKPRSRHVSLLFFGARNRVIPQPKGVVGIISPWNYPLQLAFSPLTSALAAGNRCMIKMASHSQGLCRLMRKLLSREIPEERVALLPGVSAASFTALPFHHLIFSGSPQSGRIVMKSAAANLTSVTLELGGKSPAIVLQDFQIAKAAERILHIKCVNAGQTCVAPDYLLLAADRIDRFVETARSIVAERYPSLETDDYTSIISDRAFMRLQSLLKDARIKGAGLVPLIPGAEPSRALRKIPPTLVLNVSDDMQVMQEEIFGPILPIKSCSGLNEAIAYINARPSPLAIYLFTNQSALQQKLITSTLSGGVGINDCASHVVQHDLPFGGVGNSGMGQYHGHEGFLEFSKLRPVFRQAALASTALVYPPYGKMFDRVYRFMVRFRWL